MIALFLFFVMAVAADWLSVEWHSAREKFQLKRLGILSAVLELLSWVPLWVAITQENIAWASAAIVGSIVGATLGCWKEKKRRENTTNSVDCNCCYCLWRRRAEHTG